MNRLIIVGNGFDLAHGLKTSYADFILDYIGESLCEANEKKIYSDCLIEIKCNKRYTQDNNFKNEFLLCKTLKELLDKLELNDINILSILNHSNIFRIQAIVN